MKKYLLITSAMIVFIGCKTQDPEPPAFDEANCFTVCHDKIKTLCPDANIDLDDCLARCDSWTDSTIECMSKATKCDQININEGNCRAEDTKEPYEYAAEKPIDYRCTKACYNYKYCVSYADDDTQADRNAAYNTCFQECQHWSNKTVKCMSGFRAKNTMDCMKVTQCGLNEYMAP